MHTAITRHQAANTNTPAAHRRESERLHRTIATLKQATPLPNFSSSSLLSSLELRDTQVYDPEIRALLGTLPDPRFQVSWSLSPGPWTLDSERYDGHLILEAQVGGVGAASEWSRESGGRWRETTRGFRFRQDYPLHTKPIAQNTKHVAPLHKRPFEGYLDSVLGAVTPLLEPFFFP